MDTLPVFPAAAAALPPAAWRPPEAPIPHDAHRRPDPGIDHDDDDEEAERPIGDPDDDEGVDDDDEDDDEEPLQVRAATTRVLRRSNLCYHAHLR